MDPKTKALLEQAKNHTQGVVTSYFDPALQCHSISVFPPSMTYNVSPHLMHDAAHSSTAMVRLVKGISRSIAAVVEKQIFAIMETDAKNALKASAQEMQAAFKDPNKLFLIDPAKDKDKTIWDAFYVNMAPPEQQPGITAQSLKVAWDKLNSPGTLHSAGTHDGPGVFDHLVPGGSYYSAPPAPPKMKSSGPSAGGAVLDTLRALIPGLDKMRANCPANAKCGGEGGPYYQRGLPTVIIHLNDQHKWTREGIAEWLETLDHDLTFKTPDEIKAEQVSDEEFELQGKSPEEFQATVEKLMGQALVITPEQAKELGITEPKGFGTIETPGEVKNGDSN